MPPSTFSFTKAAMNDPLFLPLRGARRTLELLNVVDAQACDGLMDLQPGLGDTNVSDAFREAMTLWKFRTDPVANFAGSQAHLALINAAPSTSNVAWGMEGVYLVSTNLPWEPLTGGNQAGQIAANIDAATLDMIGKLALTAPAIAKASKGVTQAQALITGQKSQADRFEDGVVQYLADQGADASVWRVDATFGVFGSLPLLGVTFDDAFVLLDATEGVLDGPFDLDSPLDATALLAQHAAYASGTTVRYVNASGCIAVAAARWRSTPPPGWTPAPVVPGAPATSPNGRPSRWTDWHCSPISGSANGGRTCRCISNGTGSGTLRPSVRTEVRCDCFPNANGDCLGVGSGTHPNIPPSITPGIPPAGGMTGCSCTRWWHF